MDTRRIRDPNDPICRCHISLEGEGHPVGHAAALLTDYLPHLLEACGARCSKGCFHGAYIVIQSPHGTNSSVNTSPCTFPLYLLLYQVLKVAIRTTTIRSFNNGTAELSACKHAPLTYVFPGIAKPPLSPLDPCLEVPGTASPV